MLYVLPIILAASGSLEPEVKKRPRIKATVRIVAPTVVDEKSFASAKMDRKRIKIVELKDGRKIRLHLIEHE